MNAALIVLLAIGFALTLPIYFWLFIVPMIRLIQRLTANDWLAPNPSLALDSPRKARSI
jgi:hypothetical protein